MSGWSRSVKRLGARRCVGFFLSVLVRAELLLLSPLLLALSELNVGMANRLLRRPHDESVLLLDMFAAARETEGEIERVYNAFDISWGEREARANGGGYKRRE
jgi:hypothetical protein